MKSDFFENAHTRLNIMTGEQVLVSPHRMQRSRQGNAEPVVPDSRAPYEKECYLCHGNVRVSGDCNLEYRGSFAFNAEERFALADAIKRLTTRYDNLFEISFPYAAGIHQAPVDHGHYPGWHMHFYPSLLQPATDKSFMAGYEMLADAQREITAEHAALHLRGMDDYIIKSASTATSNGYRGI